MSTCFNKHELSHFLVSLLMTGDSITDYLVAFSVGYSNPSAAYSLWVSKIRAGWWIWMFSQVIIRPVAIGLVGRKSDEKMNMGVIICCGMFLGAFFIFCPLFWCLTWVLYLCLFPVDVLLSVGWWTAIGKFELVIYGYITAPMITAFGDIYLNKDDGMMVKDKFSTTMKYWKIFVALPFTGSRALLGIILQAGEKPGFVHGVLAEEVVQNTGGILMAIGSLGRSGAAVASLVFCAASYLLETGYILGTCCKPEEARQAAGGTSV